MFGMPVILPPARLTRLAIVTLTGAAALSVAACGASNTTSNTGQPSTAAGPASSAATSSPSASTNGKAWVSGKIASVSGDAIQVTQQTGNATVDFTPSTKITQVSPAQLN